MNVEYLTKTVDLDELIISTWDLKTIIKFLKIDPGLNIYIYRKMRDIVENNIDQLNDLTSSFTSHDFIIALMDLKYFVLAQNFIKEYHNKILSELFEEDMDILIFDENIINQDILQLYFGIKDFDNSYIIDKFVNYIESGSTTPKQNIDFLNNIIIIYNAAINTNNNQVLNFLIENFSEDLLFNDDDNPIIDKLLSEINILIETAKNII